MIRILLSTRLGERRWTQADLARATGIRPSTINDLYHEIAERVNLEHLDLICEALGCELSDLMIREENPDVRVKSRTARIYIASVKPAPRPRASFARGLFLYLLAVLCDKTDFDCAAERSRQLRDVFFSKVPARHFVGQVLPRLPDASARSPIVIFCLFMIRRIFSATESPILSPPHSYYTLKCVACQKLFYDFHKKM